MFLFQGVGFGIAVLALAPSPAALLVLAASPSWWTITLVLTLACTLFCFVVMNTWQPRVTPTEAGLIYTIEPLSASVLALFVPVYLSSWFAIEYANERTTWRLLAGGALLTAANVLVQWRPVQGVASGASGSTTA